MYIGIFSPFYFIPSHNKLLYYHSLKVLTLFVQLEVLDLGFSYFISFSY